MEPNGSVSGGVQHLDAACGAEELRNERRRWRERWEKLVVTILESTLSMPGELALRCLGGGQCE